MNYVRTKDFAAADALASGNPAKAVKGVDFGLEFDNLAVAVATKVDTGGNAVLGSLATTGATGGGQGAGTINATALYLNGVVLPTIRNNAFNSGTASLNCAAITVGDTYTVQRSADGSITSNATPAIDSVLQFTNLPVGTYRITGHGQFTAGAASIGVAAGFNSSAGTVGVSQLQGIGVNQSALTNIATSSFANNIYSANTTDTKYSWSIQGAFTVTVAATVGLFWSQASSSATALLLRAGSGFSITRVA